jgi:hypothetical protein
MPAELKFLLSRPIKSFFFFKKKILLLHPMDKTAIENWRKERPIKSFPFKKKESILIGKKN